MKTLCLRFLFALAVIMTVAPAVHAQDMGAIRTRMEKRVASIDALKTQGIVGENNLGFLEVRSGDDQGVVAAENSDRTAVYAAIAQKTGAKPDAVGKARARQIATASAKGVWVQAESGQWARK